MPIQNWSEDVLLVELADDPQFSDDMQAVLDAVEADGKAAGIRRGARVIGRRTVAGIEGDEIERNVYYPDSMAKWIAGYGPDVLVLEPDVLAKAVHERLSALAHPVGDRR